MQFSLSGNSPVALSQIVALSVDNGRCGVDVDFVFPDSGFVLTVAAHNQGVFPVFTNALMFYATGAGAAAGDITIVQILNSMPPPIPIAPTEAQNHVSALGIAPANGTTQIIPAGINGTLNSLQITAAGLTPIGNGVLSLIDGHGTVVFATVMSVAVAGTSQPFNSQGMDVRFVGGLQCVISSSVFTGNTIVINAYYTTP